MLTFYSLPISNYCAKVAIVLNVKGIAHEKCPPPGGYGSARYKALVPAGTIPAIDDDGVVLSESDVISEYLEEKWPRPRLLHGDAELRGRQRFLSRFHDLKVEPNLRALFPHIAPSRRDPAFVNEKLDAFNREVARLEGFMDPGPFLLTSQIGLADCAYPATFLLADLMFEALDRTPEYGPRLGTWRRHIAMHDAVAPVLKASETATRQWIEGLTRNA